LPIETRLYTTAEEMRIRTGASSWGIGYSGPAVVATIRLPHFPLLGYPLLPAFLGSSPGPPHLGERPRHHPLPSHALVPSLRSILRLMSEKTARGRGTKVVRASHPVKTPYMAECPSIINRCQCPVGACYARGLSPPSSPSPSYSKGASTLQKGASTHLEGYKADVTDDS
jgi:hypothetical protein